MSGRKYGNEKFDINQEFEEQGEIKMTQKYDGVTCPYCGGMDICSHEIPEVIEGKMTQKIECENCEAVWLDVYKLLGWESLLS